MPRCRLFPGPLKVALPVERPGRGHGSKGPGRDPMGHGQAVSRGSLQQVRGGGPAALLTAVRHEIRTERPGGSAFVHAAAHTGIPVHGWVHGGRYHQLAPTFPPSYPGGWIQMTW